MNKQLQQVLDALNRGLEPDLDLTVEQWSDKYMIIPKATGANEYGPYRSSRTPHAREVMRCLSDNHPCKRVVAMVGSQLFKTQVCLNWFGSTVHQSPSNFLWLMPTGKLHKRIASRIDKTVAAVEVLRERIAPPLSRYMTNNQDIKEYPGGALFIATAGSAANLAEIPARRVAFDEIDRAETNVDKEGDPVKLAENRQTTFEHNRKAYYYSSPTLKGESRIDSLFNQGTAREALAECIHCGHAQPLVFENLTNDGRYPCVECGGLHEESDKPKMFQKGLWSEPKPGDGETESFTASAMFLPYGWLPWIGLVSEYKQAKEKLDIGIEEPMIVFYNTRLARTWTREKEQTTSEVLESRAEPYALQTVPEGVAYITMAVDTQDHRLEYKAVGWGEGLEAWIIDRGEIHGQPDDAATLQKLEDLLDITYDGTPLSGAFIDSGGHFTQDIYNFCRGKQRRHVYAIKGESQPNKPILSRKTKVDINHKGNYVKGGAWVWMIGTDTAKDYIAARFEKEKGQGQIHFSDELEKDYFMQLTSETRVSRLYRGKRVTSWQKKQGQPNEALDLMVYNLALAYYLGLHRLTAKQWQAQVNKINNKKNTLQDDTPKSENTPKRRKRTLAKRKNSNSLIGAGAW